MIVESIIFLMFMLILLRASLKVNMIIILSIVGLLMLQLIIPQFIIITFLIVTATITNINLKRQESGEC